jgi:molecular chaperone GrpE (heat shock protein)
MQNQWEPRVPPWPFLAGDCILLGTAYFIYHQSKLPMGASQIFFIVFCVAGGACLGIMPFLLEYRLAQKLADARTLTSVLGQIKNVEQLAGQIGSATGHWQSVQEQADRTAQLSKSISDRMGAEVKEFTNFLQQANDTERATLRLEVDKLRRAENDWLQVLVRIMDHVFALHAAAARSGQPRVLEQVGHFQSACRDAVRRLGVVPYVAEAAETFDEKRHQLAEANSKAPPGALVEETIATGYLFQGRLVRPALVRLKANGNGGNDQTGANGGTPQVTAQGTDQSQLALA